MKQVKSITLLMIVILLAALTEPKAAHAEAITADGRNELVATFLVMLGRSPSVIELAEAVAARESGKTLAQAMTDVASRSSDFASQYPGFLTGQEFAEKLTATLLGDSVPASAKDWATNWALGALHSGKTTVQVIVEAVQAVRATPNTNYAVAKQALSENVTAAVYAIEKAQQPASLSTSPSVSAIVAPKDKRATIESTLTDLLEIAEDLKIEQEDGTAFFKDALRTAEEKVKALEDKLALAKEAEKPAIAEELSKARAAVQAAQPTVPSKAYEDLKTLQSELTAANTEAALQAVTTKLAAIQKTLAPWLNFAGTNPGVDPSKTASTRALTDEGLKNLRAINDRVLTNLTGGGNVCRTRYNSTTHQYETVCN